MKTDLLVLCVGAIASSIVMVIVALMIRLHGN